MEYKVHPVEWNDEKVKRFWDFYNNYPAFENHWFSKAVGRGLIGFLKKFIPLKGKMLDYGIGKGHFTGYLLENSERQLYACDFSQETVNNINEKFRGKSNFKGCFLVQGFPSSFEQGQFDTIFLIEAIEHLTDNYLLPTIAEAWRILAPGGHLVITTPNNETLAEQHVICPDCGGIFHRVQHVRSFTADTLESLTKKYGFATVHCGGTDFQEYGKKGIMYRSKNAFKKFLRNSYQPPHLVFIGEKPKNA